MVPKGLSEARLRMFADYLQFERIALVCIMLMVGAIAIFAIVLTAIRLGGDMWQGDAFLQRGGNA